MSRYEESMNDIVIAQSALEQSLLTGTVINRPMLCDAYCIPPHNHQAFYLQVYGGRAYTLLYAKPMISDCRGNGIVMYPFKDAVKADEYIACRGDICCGIRHLPLNDPTIIQLLQCLPKAEENCLEDGIIIDGACTVVRNNQLNPPVILGYHDGFQIKLNPMTQEQTGFLNDLYLHIEGVIGNLLDSCDKRSKSESFL
ncbi:MAG: hypothetical protein PUC59_09465 [Firmicutes bacterium]|nr:hypothetical protein [Bacillota bacterium]